MSTTVEEAPRTRARTPNDEVWDACVKVLGYQPLTDSERRLWGKMVSSLTRAGATEDRIVKVAGWYRRNWRKIDLTITSLEKWYSHFLEKEQKRSEPQPSDPFKDYR